MKGQTSFLDEIIVDNFAGGGGASTGIELASGRPVTIAINHDPAAILMHKTNHPYTEHLQASVWDVNPVEVCRGRPVGLAWFSPDCKHFSKAKGSALVDRNIRGLAWIVLRWAGTVRPRVIMLENVEEFVTWGPVRKGKPVKSRQGETFRRWKQQLEDLGYTVEHRELVAADYGAPTSRKRFVLIARCDGKPIRWPERTHAPTDSEEVKSGKCQPWRSAAEIIDWSVPMYSVFASKAEIKAQYGVNAVRPLADNTLRRIIRGVDKFTIKSEKPFLIPVGYGERAGQAPRVHDINAPLSTVVSTVKQHLVKPVTAPFVAQAKFQNAAQDVQKPLSTITSVGAHELVEPIIAPYTFSNTGSSAGAAADQPVGVVRTAGGQVLAAANLMQYHTEQGKENARVNSLGAALPTVDASNRYGMGMVAANLVEYYSGGRPIDITEPMLTVTSHDREALTAAHVVKFKGQNIGQRPDEPLQTITAGGGEFSVAAIRTAKYAPDAALGYWPEVRNLLNKYCGYNLADDEILLLWLRGAWHYIHDIAIRMLTPRELYAAMGFPPDYIIDRDYTGKDYPKTQQVARCGNAVCPPMAAAVVRANFPEWGQRVYTTMFDLTGAVSWKREAMA